MPTDINGLLPAVNHSTSWKVYIRSLFDQLAGCATCALCFAPADHTGFCVDCWRELPRVTSACQCCGLPLPGRSKRGSQAAGVVPPESPFCGDCSKRRPVFDAVCAAFWYDDMIPTLIHRLKYAHRLSAARVLGEAMVPVFAQTPVPEAIVPIPLHPARLRERGFNQSIELIRPTAMQLGLPLLVNAMKRVRITQEQAGLAANQRRTNVRGAFCVGDVPYRSVALFDDVMTTGHTVSEATRVLKNAGVERVYVWLCARAAAV